MDSRDNAQIQNPGLPASPPFGAPNQPVNPSQGLPSFVMPGQHTGLTQQRPMPPAYPGVHLSPAPPTGNPPTSNPHPGNPHPGNPHPSTTLTGAYPGATYAVPTPAGPEPGNHRTDTMWTVTIIAIVATALVAAIALAAVLGEPVPAGGPTDRPTTTNPAASPTTATTGSTTPLPPLGTYDRERNALTAYETELVGGLKKGDCVINAPSQPRDGVTVVDCSEPHTDQVAGFVDLSSGMPEFTNSAAFELMLSSRCGGLYATLPIPQDFRDDGIKIFYPDPPDWEAGARIALCWVPVYSKTWVGSAIDGTAQEV